jgi:hypothetical protein
MVERVPRVASYRSERVRGHTYTYSWPDPLVRVPNSRGHWPHELHKDIMLLLTYAVGTGPRGTGMPGMRRRIRPRVPQFVK